MRAVEEELAELRARLRFAVRVHVSMARTYFDEVEKYGALAAAATHWEAERGYLHDRRSAERYVESHLAAAHELATIGGLLSEFPEVVLWVEWKAEELRVSNARWRGEAYGMVQPIARAA